MQRSDWIGLGTTVVVHAALLILFSLMTAMTPQTQPLGFIEVEFGDFARGRPVQATPETEEPPEEEPTEEETEPQPEPEPEEPATEEETEPVDLPDQEQEVEDEDNVPPPEEEEETIPPAQEEQPEDEPSEENESTDETGADSGDAGEGSTEERSAPYNIEGLNRDPVFAPLPRYAEQVDATIRVRITVDPNGRIVRQMPLLKGNPKLEQAVMDALQRWRFNSLPSNAPQEPQTGVITFRFRLE